MESQKNILEFENLYYEVKNKDKKIDSEYVRIINGLSGSIESGKVTAVMGASGCGKTHFFDLIIGTIGANAKTSGTILYNGKPRVWEEWTKKISFLPQDDVYSPDLTIMESIMNSLEFDTTKDHKEKEAIAIEALKASMIYEKRNAQIKTLSGGERKRAMIAMTLINNPEILILDEPTTGLDSNSALNIVSSLKKYAEENNTIVIVTVHQPGEGLFNLFGDLIFLTKGGLFYMGPVAKIKDFLIQNNIEVSDRVSIAEFLFLLHSGEPSNFVDTYRYDSLIKDIVYRNAAADSSSVEVSICNNSKVFYNSLNIGHSFTLLKHNALLMYKSPNLAKNLILFFVFSGFFYAITFWGTAKNFGKFCMDRKIIEDMPKSTFSDKFSLGYLIFISYFLTQVMMYGIFFSLDMTDARIFELQIFSGKYSALSYLLYQFMQKCIISMVFLTVDFFFNIYVLRDSTIPASIFVVIYLIILIFVILFTISYLMIIALPLGPKMTYFLLCMINFFYYWPSPEVKYCIKEFITDVVNKHAPKIMNLQFLFPHVNYDMFCEVVSRKIYQGLKDRALPILHEVFHWLKYEGAFKEFYSKFVELKLGDAYTLDSEFGYKTFDFKLNHGTMKFLFPTSIIFCIGVTVLLFRLSKIPNIRTKLKKD
jgi:ABC-type multidrug transport system ATPase subunit